MIKNITLIIAIFISLTACTVTRSNIGLTIAGSNSILSFAEKLAEEYTRRNPGNYVNVQGGGSTAGFTSTESGAADIGMSSRTPRANESHFWYVEIARDGLAIIVNNQNSVDNLSIAQLRAIYSGEITNWQEVGGIDANIHLISREEGSGTRGAFEELVMGETRITPRSMVQDANGAIRQVVASDPNAIGFISLGLVDETIKALKMDGVATTHENIMNGSYSLARPFLFVSYQEPTGRARQFIDFVLSEEGQAILVEEGLISILIPNQQSIPRQG